MGVGKPGKPEGSEPESAHAGDGEVRTWMVRFTFAGLGIEGWTSLMPGRGFHGVFNETHEMSFESCSSTVYSGIFETMFGDVGDSRSIRISRSQVRYLS